MTTDEQTLIDVYREIQKKGHGEIYLVVRDGKLVKLDKTEKIDIASRRLVE